MYLLITLMGKQFAKPADCQILSLCQFRKGLTGVQHYDTLSVPLVYTQVVTMAVYTYFAAALMGAQWVAPARKLNIAAQSI